MITSTNLTFGNFLSFPNFSIADNQMTFVTGASGSGKSTLLKLLNQTLIPSSGNILLDEVDISTLNPIDLRQQISLVDQSLFLFPTTIQENFKLFYDYRDLPCPSTKEMQDYLRLCLGDFALDSDCTVLSGGERQRVFLSLFLSFNPPYLLLDEPTSALDSKNAVQLMENLKMYGKEKRMTFVVVSHDENLVSTFQDATIAIKKEG